MHLLLILYSLLAGTGTLSPDGPHGRWAQRVSACLAAGPVDILAADEAAALLAFACGAGERRLVVMVNGGGVPQRVARTPPVEPLVPVFATRGDVATVPSLLVTLFDAGGTAYSNEVPPRTAVVFRPAAQADVRPSGVEE
ncbi:MAG: hypothetical protein R3181_03150 [Rubricoccaceae bacterium]|nr:hypothetical protein [Rubricoccaceae bacterium]